MKVKTILVSQPEPSGDVKSPYEELANKQKVKIDFRPFIHVEGVDATEFRKDKINIPDFSAIIFTSKNSIDYFFNMCDEIRYEVPIDLKYFCVSEAIAFYLQKYVVFRKRKIYFGKLTFQDLIPTLKKHKTEKFLLPTSDILKPDVPTLLDSIKINYTRAILYRTVCSDLSDLEDVKYDMLVFFSPLGIKSLFENFPDFVQGETRIAAFGATTHKAIAEAGLRLDIPAPTPEFPSMTMALEDYIKNANKRTS
ncbi:MAG: uroporphyrinogen-III synthase [Flavobacteriales bacterium]|nr:MAG: uroporphyrinogen-III synthase [Flavobacteriales bacterium]